MSKQTPRYSHRSGLSQLGHLSSRQQTQSVEPRTLWVRTSKPKPTNDWNLVDADVCGEASQALEAWR